MSVAVIYAKLRIIEGPKFPIKRHLGKMIIHQYIHTVAELRIPCLPSIELGDSTIPQGIEDANEVDKHRFPHP